jgi:hypothetical protein
VIYPNALDSGASIIFRPALHGVEDFVYFPRKPPEEVLRYEVKLEGIAALRQVPPGGVLEFLDAQGTPRMRVQAPQGEDAQGGRFDVEMQVRACEVNQDPGIPWGYTLSPPGSNRCILELRWNLGVTQLV